LADFIRGDFAVINQNFINLAREVTTARRSAVTPDGKASGWHTRLGRRGFFRTQLAVQIDADGIAVGHHAVGPGSPRETEIGGQVGV
jgi:hypothetical protein